MRVDAAKGDNRRIILAAADGSDGQKGFDYTSNDQMMTMKGFPFNVDHETNYVTYAGNLGGIPENWHVEYCKGEVIPRSAADIKVDKCWSTAHYFFGETAPAATGYDLKGKTANVTGTQCELACGSANGGTFPTKNYASVYTGNLRIIRGGQYMFSTTSDDGSRLTIDGNVVIDNWGLHGRRRREHLVDLDEGWHNVTAEHFVGTACGANCTLNVNYKGDDTDDKEIAINEHMFHGKTAPVVVNPTRTVDSAESNPVGSSTININKNSIGGVSHAAVIAPFLEGSVGSGVGHPNPGSTVRA